MPDPSWKPSEDLVADARITHFCQWVHHERGLQFEDYEKLHHWSVDQPGEFWQAIWDYFGVMSDTKPGTALADDSMPGATWFPGTRLNYVDHVFRNASDQHTAIIETGEPGSRHPREISWAELERQVGALAATLRDRGVGRGDRVVGYLPNIAEAVVAFLASASLGAIWAGCGQDYSSGAALDRFRQLEPSVLITADGYRYGGTPYDRQEAIAAVQAGLPTLHTTILISRLRPGPCPGDALPWAAATAGDQPLITTRVPFDHPLWVAYTSGTSGPPKGLVHGHGGVLLEHLKSLGLQLDLGPDDVFFWYTTPSWTMWNSQVAGLLVGATILCYDGSPSSPEPDALWELAARYRVTMLGTSPRYVLGCEKADTHPGRKHDLSSLRQIGSTGAALPEASYHWIAEHVGAGIPVLSSTGGTDVATGFAGCVVTTPVWPGELYPACLGVALDVYDDNGRSVRDQPGELVVTRPMPSMPVRLWNDPAGERYRETYFDVFPGVWRHGDSCTITSHGRLLVHGRSDATLNRNGIRMGSAEIYHALERLPEIVEALIVGVDLPGDEYWMPLFVHLRVDLDDGLKERIRQVIRVGTSPWHVPDEIISAPGVPHTRTGKKLEIPVKRLLQGAPLERVVQPGAVDQPELLDWYDGIGRLRRAARASN